MSRICRSKLFTKEAAFGKILCYDNQLDDSKSCAVLVVSPLMVDQTILFLIVAHQSIIAYHTEITRQVAEVARDEIYDHCIATRLSFFPSPSVRMREPGDEANYQPALNIDHYQLINVCICIGIVGWIYRTKIDPISIFLVSLLF